MTGQPQLQRRSIFRNWWFWLCASVLLVIGLWTPVCLQRTEAALSRDDVYRAESWLTLTDWQPWPSRERAFLRMRLARKLGRVDEFTTTFKAAHAAGVDSRRLQREVWLQQAQSGDLQPLEEQLPQLLMEGDDLQEICHAYVLGCMMQFRIGRALDTLKVWQADFPNDPRPPYLRGRLLEHQADLVGATREYQSALRLAPDYAPAAINLARAELSQQQHEAALNHYRIAARALPEPQPAIVGIARCLRELGRFEEAKAELRAALTAPSERLIEAYRLVGERSETALAQAPAEMAQLELATDHPEEAIPWFEQAIAADPLDWKLRFSYGQTLRRTGNATEAEEQISRAEASRMAFESCDLLIDRVRDHPDDVEARYQIGCVLLEHLSENQGLVWLNSIFEFDPQHQAAHQKLAEYYEAHIQEHPEFAQEAARHRAALQASAAATSGQ